MSYWSEVEPNVYPCVCGQDLRYWYDVAMASHWWQHGENREARIEFGDADLRRVSQPYGFLDPWLQRIHGYEHPELLRFETAEDVTNPVI